jgi:hypothetical protein
MGERHFRTSTPRERCHANAVAPPSRPRLSRIGGVYDPLGGTLASAGSPSPSRGSSVWTAAYLNRGLCQVRGRVVVGWCGCGRSAGARAYLGARPLGRRRDGRWVDPLGATPAARSLVDRRPWAGVATVAGAGRKRGCHLRTDGLGGNESGGSGDWLQGIGTELAQGVEATAGEFAGDRQRGSGVREPACLEREVVGAVGAGGPAGRLG